MFVATFCRDPRSPHLSKCPSARALYLIPISLFTPLQYLLYTYITLELSRLELLLLYYNKILRGIIIVIKRPLELLSNYSSRIELNYTLRHKLIAISTLSNNPLGQHYNVQFNVAISAQQLVAKHNKIETSVDHVSKSKPWFQLDLNPGSTQPQYHYQRSTLAYNQS